MIRIRQATKGLGYIDLPDDGGLADLSFPTSNTRRGRVQKNGSVSPTICTSNSIHYLWREKNMKLMIKKLSPKECIKLMGMNDEDYYKMKAIGMSNTQIYKQAGNGLVSNCVEYIAQHMFKAYVDPTYTTYDEKMQPTINPAPSFSKAVQETA